MNTRHLVDPELLPLVDQGQLGPITNENLAERRAAMAAGFAKLPKPATEPGRHFATGADGESVPILVYQPPSGEAPHPAVFHIHGGGMISGTAQMTMRGPAPPALDLGCAVVSVDYRLAPETPFPGPQEDCYAAATWLFANAERFGIDPARIAISGVSAGGGLAAAVALMARDRGGPRFAAQLLTYPMLDHRTGGPDDVYGNPVTSEFMWTRELNRFGWNALRGGYAIDDARVGWFSPSRSADLSNLPPAWLATGSLDLFFDETLDYARRLCAAGVPVECHSYAGAVHGFNGLAEAKVTQQYNLDYSRALERLLAATGPS